MYLCIHVSMYICIYVRMYVCIYVSMYLCIYVSMYLCIYVVVVVSTVQEEREQDLEVLEMRLREREDALY